MFFLLWSPEDFLFLEWHIAVIIANAKNIILTILIVITLDWQDTPHPEPLAEIPGPISPTSRLNRPKIVKIIIMAIFIYLSHFNFYLLQDG
ncbi:hypothetical protein LR61_02430 [Morganella morganii]|nr:hypothetical protein LR61_02430 [Morganella morganii]